MSGVPPQPRATAVLLRRAVRAEWTRLWSVRTPRWCLVVASVAAVVLGLLIGFDDRGDLAAGVPPGPVGETGQTLAVPLQLPLLLLVLLATTSPYTTGTVRSALQWVPDRRLLLAAALLVPVAVATVASVLLALTVESAVWLAGARQGLDPGGLLAGAATVGAVVLGGSLVAAGAGHLLRSAAGSLLAVVALTLVLPVLLLVVPLVLSADLEWLDTVRQHLPGPAGLSLLAPFEVGTTTTRALLALAAWAVLATAAGGRRLLTGDV